MKNSDYEKIVRKYSKKIFNYLLKFHKNKEDAEDILQNTFIDFYKKVDTVDSRYYSAYLFRMAHNKSVNLYKRKQKVTHLETEFYSETKDYDEEVIKSANNHDLKKVLQSLKKNQLQVIELKYYQNKSYKEISEIMEITESAVESHLVRARKKIRKKMQDLGYEPVSKSRK